MTRAGRSDADFMGRLLRQNLVLHLYDLLCHLDADICLIVHIQSSNTGLQAEQAGLLPDRSLENLVVAVAAENIRPVTLRDVPVTLLSRIKTCTWMSAVNSFDADEEVRRYRLSRCTS